MDHDDASPLAHKSSGDSTIDVRQLQSEASRVAQRVRVVRYVVRWGRHSPTFHVG